MTNRTVGTLLALSIVLVGCTSDDKKPTVLPPAPSAPFGNASVPFPSIPSEATAETSEGASAFARHYMNVLTVATQSADATQLRTLSDAGCGGCQNLIQAIEAARSMGQRVKGADFRVAFAVAPAFEGNDTIVDVRYERVAGELVDADDTLVSSIPAEGVIDAQIRLMRTSESWIVLGFRAVQAP